MKNNHGSPCLKSFYLVEKADKEWSTSQLNMIKMVLSAIKTRGGVLEMAAWEA